MSSYVSELTAWAEKKRNLSRRDKNMVVFLAVKKDLIAAIDAGYTLRTIWLHMVETKRLGVSYDSFLNYVTRYLRPDVTQQPVRDKVKPSRTSEVPGFKFNPVGKKEDLL